LFLRVSQRLQDRPSRRDLAPWTDSPYLWVKTADASKTGAAGEEFATAFLTDLGFRVDRYPGSDFDRVVNGLNLEIKTSTLTHTVACKGSWLQFQHIVLGRKTPDFVMLVGVMPDQIRLWWADPVVLRRRLSDPNDRTTWAPVHGGDELHVTIRNEHEWREHGGDPEHCAAVVRAALKWRAGQMGLFLGEP